MSIAPNMIVTSDLWAHNPKVVGSPVALIDCNPQRFQFLVLIRLHRLQVGMPSRIVESVTECTVAVCKKPFWWLPCIRAAAETIDRSVGRRSSSSIRLSSGQEGARST
ncbi:hypothetical protein HDF13_000529 [Edaphobacter lichenicola]|uniref:Uncharacterized protein n=1 Tax=Tunturiibacter gelidiferens TaxID=3069689 RepID=A0ACC5NUT9_9BACT|nr:hypothetical protein [Edaphobacter lichenicola]